MFRHLLPAAAVLAAILLTGCGGGSSLAKVKGTVSYKGQPLKQGYITFTPEKDRAASGKIVDGNIVDVTTKELNDGVAVGACKVTITAMDSDDIYKAKSVIPAKYGDNKQSGLTADIKPGMNELKFDLK